MKSYPSHDYSFRFLSATVSKKPHTLDPPPKPGRTVEPKPTAAGWSLAESETGTPRWGIGGYRGQGVKGAERVILGVAYSSLQGSPG